MHYSSTPQVAFSQRAALIFLHLIACMTFSHAEARAGAIFIGIGDLAGGDYQSRSIRMSGDGRVVVGQSSSSNTDGMARTESFRWTAESGMVGLGDLPGGAFSSTAFGVSFDGAVIVGRSSSALSSEEAFRWTAETGIVGIGFIPFGNNRSSDALAVSHNGSVIVGRSRSLQPHRSEAFQWSEELGLVGVGDLPGGRYSSDALGISGNGSVIVGSSFSDGDFVSDRPEAFRWTADEGMVGLGRFPGGDSTSATAASRDGQIIVGSGTIGGGISSFTEAFRWTAADGLIGLGHFPDEIGFQSNSFAQGVSGDGDVVVGTNVSNAVMEAFVWDLENGIRSVADVLAEQGVDLGGWQLLEATSISDDGRSIAGEGINPDGKLEGWVAHLDETVLAGDYNRDGAVDVQDYEKWRRDFGKLIPLTHGADGNGDGAVNAADYTIWRDAIAVQNGIFIPEPRAMPLVATLIGLVSIRRTNK